jgi:hypothetical protein
MRFTRSQTGSRPSWPGLTRISAALDLCVPSCPGPWKIKHFGSLRSELPSEVVSDVVQLINCYKKLFLDAQPVDGDDADYKSIVVVFIDLSAAQAKDFSH